MLNYKDSSTKTYLGVKGYNEITQVLVDRSRQETNTKSMAVAIPVESSRK